MPESLSLSQVNDDVELRSTDQDGTTTNDEITGVPDGGYGQPLLNSTLSFVGTLSNTCIVALGLIAVCFLQLVGARITGIVGVLLFGRGEICSGSVAHNIGGLFGTTGVLLGSGGSLLYMSANVIPNQYFNTKLGLANGIIKSAGGIGGTVLSLALHGLINRVGISWTFRIIGLAVLGTGSPAAWFMKERRPMTQSSLIKLSMFRQWPVVAIFLAGATGTFALFVPPFFLPLFAASIGLSSGTGAGLVAGFNLCTTVGGFGAGPLCDIIGPVNTFLLAMLLNTISMFAIWPISSTLGPLVVFAMLNGVANGAFFTTFPTVAATMFRKEAAIAMSTATLGWSGGDLMDTPIAGLLLQSQNTNALSIQPYRPTIFYAGGVACASTVFILLARFGMDKKLIKRL